MKNRLKLFFLILILIFVVTTVLMVSDNKPQNNTLIPVKFAVSKAMLTIPVLIAHKNGYFLNHGLDIEFSDQYSSGKTAFEAMLRGEADISTAATTPLVVKSFNYSNFSTFITYSTTYDGVKLIAKTDTALKSDFELNGKKIGVVKGTISQLLLNSFLTYKKILPTEVQILFFPASELPLLLKDGTVDVISIWEPFATQAIDSIPQSTMKISTDQIYRMAINLASMNKFAIENPDILERIILSLQDAILFIINKEQEAIILSSELLELDELFVQSIWYEYNFSLSLDQLLIRTMEYEAKWLIDNNYISAVDRFPNFLNFVNLSALENTFPLNMNVIQKD